eukprot:COSAG01_NODE_20178_length_966_cov_5.855825_2_plen_81_part_00
MVLQRFMVPGSSQVVVPEDIVREAVEAMFISVGMRADAARECTDVLVASDLRGNDSHGVSNVRMITPAPCFEGVGWGGVG